MIVVPSAVVRHAQAGYLGLRSDAIEPGSRPVDRDGDGEDDRADPRRSFAARRRALVHSRLVSAPLPLVPVVALAALLGAVLRAFGQLAAKQPGLAVDEVRAALVALARPDGVVRSRLRRHPQPARCRAARCDRCRPAGATCGRRPGTGASRGPRPVGSRRRRASSSCASSPRSRPGAASRSPWS